MNSYALFVFVSLVLAVASGGVGFLIGRIVERDYQDWKENNVRSDD